MVAFKLRNLRKPSVQSRCAGRDGARRVWRTRSPTSQAMRVMSHRTRNAHAIASAAPKIQLVALGTKTQSGR